MLEHPHLVLVVDDNGEAARGDLRQLVGLEEALEQQDAPDVVLGAQRDRRVELDQRESVGLRERRKHAQQAVSVGVRLDDRDELRVRRQLARAREVAREAREGSLARRSDGPLRAIPGCRNGP